MKKPIISLLAAACFLLARSAQASFDGTNFTSDAPVTIFTASADVTIAGANYGNAAYSGAALLIISNSTVSNIDVYWAAPGFAIGLETTNQESVPAGEFVVYTINTFNSNLVTYQSQLERPMPALNLPAGNTNSTGGSTNTNTGGNTNTNSGGNTNTYTGGNTNTNSGGNTNITSSGPTNTGPIGEYITNGLIVNWVLNDGSGTTAPDSSGFGNTLTLAGSPTWSNDCVELNGSTQYGTAGTAAGEVVWQDMSVSAWVLKTGNSYKSIVDKSFVLPFVGYGGWGLWVQADGHLVYWGGQSCVDNGPLTVVPGKWTFVQAVWHAGLQAVDFYIDGVWNSRIANSSVMDTATWGLATLELGNIQTTLPPGNYEFDGAIRQVAIYDRALSAQEVGTNYLNTELDPVTATPDLLYYKMTEYNQTTPPIYLADSSVAGQSTGTLTDPNNSVEWVANQAGLPHALHFNGASTVLDTGNAHLFNFTTNAFTINAWLLPLTANGFVMGNATYQQCGWFMQIGGSYEVIFGSENPGSETAISTSTPMANWPTLYHMITVTREANGTPQIYMDGEPQIDLGAFASPAFSPNDLIFGASVTGGNILDGDIFQPQIWSTALGPNDIGNLYWNQIWGIPWP